jgi:hypothetical protein
MSDASEKCSSMQQYNIVFLPVLIKNSWYLKYSAVRSGLFAELSGYGTELKIIAFIPLSFAWILEAMETIMDCG